MPWSRGGGCTLRLFLLAPSTSAICGGVVRAKMDTCLYFCNSSCVMCIVLLRFESFWRMRGLRSGELGVGSKVFSIITSLASGGVMVLPGVVVVKGSCGGVVSIVGSL